MRRDSEKAPTEPLDYKNPATKPQPVPYRDYVEIEIGRTRKWVGRALYVLAFAALSSLLVWMFVMLNTTFALAVSVVVFMVAYMLVMGMLASRGHDQSRNSF